MVNNWPRAGISGSAWRCIECGELLESGLQVIQIAGAAIDTYCSALCLARQWLRNNPRLRNDLLDISGE